ncbi:MAG TPA: NUDIX domain-containing protein [Planctomycetota bacterium]|nr:NUDIX domain-containing protein [Planctomycetota bacterium]
MTNQTQVSVAGALFSGDGKLLILRRLDGAWELPNGPLEFGEEPEVGIARVFAELTAIDTVPDRPLGAWSTLDAAGETHTHAICVGYTVTLSGALLSVELDTEKHSAFAWILQDELEDKIDTPAMRKACQRAFGMLARTRRNK